MANAPTDNPTGVESGITTAGDQPHPLIGRERWAAWRHLLEDHGNAFMVGAQGADRVVLLLAWDFLSRPLSRAEVANLVAWLVMVGSVTAADLEPICQAQGFSLRTALELAGPPPPARRGSLARRDR